MKRSEMEYPNNSEIDNLLYEFLINAWYKGWFDDYSEDHFLIKALESRLTDFVGKEQLINNNLKQYNIVKDGVFYSDSFCTNFCINFSAKMKALVLRFGEDEIKRFVIDQLSAGKKNYREDAFFEALSEVSVLAFMCRIGWTKYEYEPMLNSSISKKNPEARFVFDSSNINFSVNIEVKSPAFSHDGHNDEKIIIPTILLTSKGREKLQKYCKRHDITCLFPRILKLRDFINSASRKFAIPNSNEFNILYINWSYSDFPSNSYLEAWALLTNSINGVLSNPKYAEMVGIENDVFKKISAIIVYTESLEGLMFQSFDYVWQSNKNGPRFRMWVNRQLITENESDDYLRLFHEITQMNPSKPLEQYLMVDLKPKSDDEQIMDYEICSEIINIILKNVLKI